jgi:hypothetical protein
MAATKQKRSSAPSAKPKKTSAKRQYRRSVPTSQYTDVGQRRSALRPKPAPKTNQPVATQSVATDNEATNKAVAAAKQLIAFQPVAAPQLSDTPPQSTDAPVATPNRIRRRLVLPIAVLFALALAGFAAWRQHHQPESVATLVSQVSRVTVLPANETPVVSTIVDKQRVTQSFLASAENGDKVLLYYQAKKAIVYRPSTRQVITIGPIAQGAARVFIRGGGASAAALKRIQTAIASDAASFTVASQDVSPNPHYNATEVVDLTGVRPDVASKLAALIDAKVGSLPAGEHRPDGDLLVIAGSDAQ